MEVTAKVNAITEEKSVVLNLLQLATSNRNSHVNNLSNNKPHKDRHANKFKSFFNSPNNHRRRNFFNSSSNKFKNPLSNNYAKMGLTAKT